MGTLYAQLKAVLLANGCSFARQGSGSHEIWYSPITQRHFPVAVTVKSRHTVNGILKRAGITSTKL